ncbi:hypothetical protein F441_19408 [Phytophthora nicotianae CJ01A1]|uniref:Uncharacterized protein n=1 Tax=Phytophthora nicotianae CJ01A1 TaxID=1317063 RepID=W2VZR6_PHYNI|nr:hypothetical protein F441_19408 [Phytophthora nicotianae CJ01A1]
MNLDKASTTYYNRLVWHDVDTTVAGEIFQQDRWMNGSGEESNEPNKRAMDVQDRAQRNREESQAEKARDPTLRVVAKVKYADLDITDASDEL